MKLTESISLAFITALQLLPPRQRAALILRDVLGFPPVKRPEILDTTEESVTRLLRHARAAWNASVAPPTPHRRRTPRRNAG